MSDLSCESRGNAVFAVALSDKYRHGRYHWLNSVPSGRKHDPEALIGQCALQYCNNLIALSHWPDPSVKIPQTPSQNVHKLGPKGGHSCPWNRGVPEASVSGCETGYMTGSYRRHVMRCVLRTHAFGSAKRGSGCDNVFVSWLMWLVVSGSASGF